MDGSPSADFWRGRWQSGSTPWDHGSAAPPLVEWLARRQADGAPLSGRALVPGCGSGHEVRLFAEAGMEVTGLDFAPEALASATHLNAHPRAEFRCGDFLQPPADLLGNCDCVIEHTCLCAMAPESWPAYVAAVQAVLRPGGCFLGIFYVRTKEPGGPPYEIAPEVIDRLFAGPFVMEERVFPMMAFPSRVGREELRRYRYTP